MIERCLQSIKALPTGRRLIAVAGPPASGKSTFAEALCAGLIRQGLKAAVVPMDGFHLDNATLRDRGLLPHKGAPETFDVTRFTALIQDLQLGGDVPIPLFDRTLDCVLPGAATVPADCDLVIVEGNYLLFDDPDWRHLGALWDLSIYIAPPLPELRARLIRRWLDHGLDPETARKKADENDLPNARAIVANRLSAHLQF